MVNIVITEAMFFWHNILCAANIVSRNIHKSLLWKDLNLRRYLGLSEKSHQGFFERSVGSFYIIYFP